MPPTEAAQEQVSENTGIREPDEIFGPPTEDDDEPEPQAAAPAPAAQPAAQAPAETRQTHPDALVRRARLWRIPQSEIDLLPTNDLADVLFGLEERARQQQPQVVQHQVAPQQDESDDDLLAHAANQVGMDPKVVKLLTRQSQKLRQVEQIAPAIAALAQREQQRQVRSSEDAFDAAFDAMIEADAGYEGVFGKGDGRTLGNDSDELARRLAVLNESKVNPAEDSQAAIQRKVRAAAKKLFGKAQAPAASAAPAPAPPPPSPYAAVNGNTNGRQVTPEEWAAGTVARTTGGNGKPRAPRSREAAIKAVVEKYRAFGIKDTDAGEQLQGVPG